MFSGSVDDILNKFATYAMELDKLAKYLAGSENQIQ